MSLRSETEVERGAETSKCLARSVADALAHEPTLEAVTINRGRQTISVATLGKVDVPKLTESIAATVRKAQAADTNRHCNLLAGEGDCQTCDTPLSPPEQARITIRREGDKTTIARVTCPTAPTFWR